MKIDVFLNYSAQCMHDVYILHVVIVVTTSSCTTTVKGYRYSYSTYKTQALSVTQMRETRE
jgi:hypothetical protein